MEDSEKNLSRLILARPYLTKLHKPFNCSSQDSNYGLPGKATYPLNVNLNAFLKRINPFKERYTLIFL